eukprot:1161036-Pelagomonas_calceolata.AAC.9
MHMLYEDNLCFISNQPQQLQIMLDRLHERKTSYVGKGNSPYLNLGKGDTLAQKSHGCMCTLSRED